MAAEAPVLMDIERIVGALAGVAKGRAAPEVADGIRRYLGALGNPAPAWFTEDFVVGVQEELRKIVGRWNATAFGASMELEW